MLKRLVSIMTAFAAAAFYAFSTYTAVPVRAASGEAETSSTADASEAQNVKVRVELECVDTADGWNADTYGVELVDTAGNRHDWNINVSSLNAEHAKQTKTFDIGTARPLMICAYPDFGGGWTNRDYGLIARIWVDGSSTAMESEKVLISSSWFKSSRYDGNHMEMSFKNYGKSKVGNKIRDDYINWTGSYTDVTSAWKAANSIAGNIVVQLESPWLPESLLTLPSGKNVTIDLNGYPIIRPMQYAVKSGEVLDIAEKATLTIIDSAPDRQSSKDFTGGSIQGGNSSNTGGLIQCAGTLNMTGGTLYEGSTVDKGGAVKLYGNAKATLTNVTISNCISNGASVYDNDGGAIYMRDNAAATLNHVKIAHCRAYDYGGAISMEGAGNRLTCNDVHIMNCFAEDNKGGALYQSGGEVTWDGGSIANCSAADEGGAICQDAGTLEVHNVSFANNSANGYGGAVCINTYDKTWLVGCSMTQNTSKSYGGAVYCNYDNLYMEDCLVVGNAAVEEGGGIFIDYGTLDLSGKMVIKNNDGRSTLDNLVLENGSYLYDHGIDAGSEIHVRSRDDGSVYLGQDNRISRYKLEKYFFADYGKLEIADVQAVDTQLAASVFTTGKTALYIGASLVILFMAFGIVYMRKGKGE